VVAWGPYRAVAVQLDVQEPALYVDVPVDTWRSAGSALTEAIRLLAL